MGNKYKEGRIVQRSDLMYNLMDSFYLIITPEVRLIYLILIWLFAINFSARIILEVGERFGWSRYEEIG